MAPESAQLELEDAIFPYMCLQRRWPHQHAPPLPEHPDDDGTAAGTDDGSGSDAALTKATKAGHVEAGIPWHVDGGPSICFMALTLETWLDLDLRG